MVSGRDSPLATDDELSLTEITVPPSRSMAAWNDDDVRVDGS
jgi:hypothetical protein